MSGRGPEPVERDSRGILDPWLLRERVQLTRYPAGPALAGLVDRFWAVCWDLPPGQSHRQQVLTHPGANISVGHANTTPGQREPGPVEARLNGVARGLASRLLVGSGWTVAAMTRPGGLGAFVAGSAAAFTDRVVPLGAAIGVAEAALVGTARAAALFMAAPPPPPPPPPAPAPAPVLVLEICSLSLAARSSARA